MAVISDGSKFEIAAVAILALCSMWLFIYLRRRWRNTGGRFRLHLSTIVVLTLVAGALIGVNAAPRNTSGAAMVDDDTKPLWRERGWPTASHWWYPEAQDHGGFIYWPRLALNANAFMLLLACAWVLLERPWRKSPT